MQKFDIEIFNLKELSEGEGKELYQVKLSNSFGSLENLDDDDVDTNRALETVRANVQILSKGSLGNHELKNHKPWVDEGSSKLLAERKQTKLQWLQDPIKVNGYNLNNARREVSRNFRKEVYT